MARRVGIGIMGTAMMRNLVADGFEAVGCDISGEAMARLTEARGIAAASPREVAEQAGIVITSLPGVDASDLSRSSLSGAGWREGAPDAPGRQAGSAR